MSKETESKSGKIGRRSFLKAGALAGGGMVLSSACKSLTVKRDPALENLTPLQSKESLVGVDGRPLDPKVGAQFRAADWAKGSPPWTDLSKSYPTLDPMQVRDGLFGAMKGPDDEGHVESLLWGLDGQPGYAATFPHYPGAAQWPRIRGRHSSAFVKMGRTDNVEVGIVQRMPDWQSTYHQCAPTAFVATDAKADQVCWLFNYDVSLFKPSQVFYGQNGFAQKPSTHFIDFAFYTTVGKGPLTWPTPLAGSTMRIVMRCVNGKVQNVLSDGTTTLVSEPYERPAWTEGRDGWGFRSLALWFPEGEKGPVAPDFQVVEPQGPPSIDRILAWWARPYDEPLQEK